jgi:DNA-binding transcriptional regulator YiaG
LAVAEDADAASPTLSISNVPPATLQFSWSSDLPGWQLMSATNLLARLTISQRSIHVVLPSKTSVSRHDKPFPTTVKTIGDLLVARRKEAGLTQEKLAEITGIHRQWLGRWERGRVFPSPAQWSLLCTVLRLPAEPELV